MFRKSILCLMAMLLIFGFAAIASGKDAAKGAGVKAVKDVLDVIIPHAKKKLGIEITTKEEKADATIEAIGKGKDFGFGMMTRGLNDAEKKTYPNIKTFLIAKDGVAVVVHPDNPVKALTTAQLRDIFAGKITDWSQVGGSKGKIAVNIREKGSGQRTALEKVIMGSEKVTDKAIVFDKMGTMKDDVALSKASIGYITVSAVDKSVKAIEIDGKPATAAALKAGTYPVEVPIMLITNGEPTGATKAFIDYLFSPEGQKSLERQKLAPVGATK